MLRRLLLLLLRWQRLLHHHRWWLLLLRVPHWRGLVAHWRLWTLSAVLELHLVGVARRGSVLWGWWVSGILWHRLVALRVTGCSRGILVSLYVVRNSPKYDLLGMHTSRRLVALVEYHILRCTLRWHLDSLLLQNVVLIRYARSHISHLANDDLFTVANEFTG